jgi:hypothetical protein
VDAVGGVGNGDAVGAVVATWTKCGAKGGVGFARPTRGREPIYSTTLAAARTNAQRFLVASTILFRPAALSFRFGF